MAVPQRIFLAVLVFCTLFCGGLSIHCFYCNSANNSACLDLSKYDGETLSRIIPVVECNVASPNQLQFFCRKIVQTIYHSEHENELRVTRGCGWIRNPKKDCYSANNRDHLETVCQCFSDRCNSADSADPTSCVFLFLVFSAVLYFYR